MTGFEDQFAELNTSFEEAYPQEVLRWAAESYGDRLAVVTSFQPTGIVTLHMLSEIVPKTTVLTLDTGLLFPETYTLMDELEQRLNLRLIRVRPRQTVEQQTRTHGANLWEHDPDKCCNMRKTIPLGRMLGGYDAWITGLRRDQSNGRRATPVVSWDSKHEKVKLSPLATWTEDMVWAYIHAHELPYNPLHDQNYSSIGCYPCTQPVAPDSPDKRAGRWSGHGKTECGIHIATENKGDSIVAERQQGFTLWLTGLSGAGKTTISVALEKELRTRDVYIERLDGDTVREGLTRDLGFSKEDRDKNIERVTYVAKLLSRNGVGVVAAFISPYREARQKAREQINNFIEVYVNASLEVCAERDVKGLYAKAFAGELKGFTGVDDPYEAPESPELVVHSGQETLEESVAQILQYLEERALIPAAVTA
jgi:adenylyl-sulfate kinase